MDKLSDISPADILSATQPTETNATTNDVSSSCKSLNQEERERVHLSQKEKESKINPKTFNICGKYM